MQTKFAVATNSCTAALHLALHAVGVGPGDEVITSPLTFVATANVIEHCGATPVFADVRPDDGTIDPDAVSARVTARTKAIIPVHYAGALADVATLRWRHPDLPILVDAAHAIEGRHASGAGPAGDGATVAAFSFYVTKNLGTGEGGMLVTDDEEIASAASIASLHGLDNDAWKRYSSGRYGNYELARPGWKYNMTDMQAALGIHQLARIERSLARRAEIWSRYNDAFRGLPGITIPPVALEPDAHGRHARHLYTLWLDWRELGSTGRRPWTRCTSSASGPAGTSGRPPAPLLPGPIRIRSRDVSRRRGDRRQHDQHPALGRPHRRARRARHRRRHLAGHPAEGEGTGMTDLGRGGRRPSGIGRYLTAFRDRWLVIAAIVVVAVGATAAYSLLAAKRYKAEADLIVNRFRRRRDVPRDQRAASRLEPRPAGDHRRPHRRLRARQPPGRGEPRRGARARRLGQPAQPEQHRHDRRDRRRAARGGASRERVRRRRDHCSPHDLPAAAALGDGEHQRADRAAEGPAAADLRARLAMLEAFVGRPEPTLSILSAATPPDSASWPRPKLSIVVALLASLLVGAGAALALDIRNPLVKDRDELLFEHRLPILGEISRARERDIRHFLARRRPLPPEVLEGYRTIGRTLEHAGDGEGLPRSILITSASSGEGKTTTAIALAEAIAQSGRSVILVDGDLRRPMITAVFGLPAKRRSIAAVLRGTTPAREALKQSGGLKLLLGAPDPAAVDLVNRSRVGSVVDQLTAEADVVVIDSSPLGEVADALAFADAVEAVLVAVRLGHTRRDRLADLRQRLAQVGVSPSGAIVIDRKRLRASGYRYADLADRERLLGLGQEPDPRRTRPRNRPSLPSPGPVLAADGLAGTRRAPSVQGRRGE